MDKKRQNLNLFGNPNLDKLVSLISRYFPGTKISNASNRDINNALELIAKFGIADLDALGPPTADDYAAPWLNAGFISQEDSKTDKWDPKNHQNQGKWQNDMPSKPKDSKPTKPQPKAPDIDERMLELTKLMEAKEKGKHGP